MVYSRGLEKIADTRISELEIRVWLLAEHWDDTGECAGCWGKVKSWKWVQLTRERVERRAKGGHLRSPGYKHIKSFKTATVECRVWFTLKMSTLLLAPMICSSFLPGLSMTFYINRENSDFHCPPSICLIVPFKSSQMMIPELLPCTLLGKTSINQGIGAMRNFIYV